MRPLVILLALAALLACAPTAHGRALEVGIAADGLLLNGSETAGREAVERWRELGIDTVRLQVQWSRVAPDSGSPTQPAFDPANPEGGYNWGDVDRAMRLIVSTGLRPILLLGGPPPLWASGNPAAGNPRLRPSSWQFGKFAAAVSARYGPVVEEYILWNEPNLPLWIQPQAQCAGKSCSPVSPHIYRYMVSAAYPAIKAVDPQSKVLIGALAPTGGRLTSRNANMKPLRWLRAFGCLGDDLKPIRTGPCRSFQPAPADGFAYHPHSTKHPPNEPYPNPDDASLASLKRIEKVLDAMQDQGRLNGTTRPLGIWLDEYAYQTNPPDKLRGVTPGRQDRYLQEAAYIAWRNPRVQNLTQYLWRDERMGGGKRYTGWQSGLLTIDGDEKPALAHFDDPLWVDIKRNVIWGQIRPGGEHDVEIQVRGAGAGTNWQPVQRRRTVADGSFFITTPVQPFASYRAVYDGGRRSTGVIVATQPDDDGRHVERNEKDPSGLPVERRQAGPVAGAAIPRSFAGFSMEWTAIPDYIGSGGQVNPVFANLTGWLSKGANGAPTLRFGGESTEHTWWNPTRAPRPPGVFTDIDQAWLDQLALWVRTARTPLVVGLNMGLRDPAQSAAMARAIHGAVPPGFLKNFELGNEPDLYATPRAYSVGRNVRIRQRKRPEGYGYPQYRQEVNEFVGAIHPAAPSAGLSGGGFASGAWDDLQDDILSVQPSVRSWSAHAYPLQTCDRDIRKRGGQRFIPKLLAPTAFTSIVDRMRHLVAVAASHGGTVQVTETNSAICGGLRGVSDTMASALWGTDLLFGLAEAGVRNVDFHTWTGSHYGPIDFRRHHGRTVAKVRPLFYGMLLFNRATPPGSKLIPVGPNAGGARLKTWGTIDPAGTRRFVVINKDPRVGRKLVLTLPGAAARTAAVERLVAPSLRSENNVTFGGRGWGGLTSDGTPEGKRRVERAELDGRTLRLVIPRGSAALVTVRPGGR
jgi:hypothetical protein